MARYTVLGTSDERDTCEVCGKTPLKYVVVLRSADDASAPEVYAGKDCAAELLGRGRSGKAADRTWSEAQEAERERASAAHAALFGRVRASRFWEPYKVAAYAASKGGDADTARRALDRLVNDSGLEREEVLRVAEERGVPMVPNGPALIMYHCGPPGLTTLDWSKTSGLLGTIGPGIYLYTDINDARASRFCQTGGRSLYTVELTVHWGEEMLDAHRPASECSQLAPLLGTIKEYKPSWDVAYVVGAVAKGAKPEAFQATMKRAGVVGVYSHFGWKSPMEVAVFDPSRMRVVSEARKSMTPNGRASMPRAQESFDRHFDEMAARFPDFGELELHHDEAAGGDNGHGSERQFGFCSTEAPWQISFAAKIEKLPGKYIDGLVAHEFGHAIDHRYGRVALERVFGKRLPDSVERRADKIAEYTFGRLVEYGDLDIQCIACEGKKQRPKRLG